MNNKVAALTSIIVIVLALPIITKYFTTRRRRETFKNYDISKISDLGSQAGNYPSADTNVLVQDTFPITGIYGVSDDTASKIWWHYPIFEVGSYEQITNNIRYPKNPDNGTCTATDMCGALYKDRKTPSNYVKPLPPVNPNSGTRVGYFGTRLK
jgi:hypothetical protein